MPALPSRAVAALLFYLVAGTILFWSRLSADARRVVALVMSVFGVLFLLQATQTEGSREAPTLTAFLFGEPAVAGVTAAAASLPFYLMSGLCLLLGTLGLALGERAVAKMRRHPLAVAVGLSLAITALRFALEKVATPAAWAWAVGVVFLPPLVGAWFATNRIAEGKTGMAPIAGSLLIYALCVRGVVTVLIILATTFGLGSHYDVSSVVSVKAPWSDRRWQFVPRSARQIVGVGVLPQLLFWPPYTVVTGLLGAGIAMAALRSSGKRTSQRDVPDQPLPASEPR